MNQITMETKWILPIEHIQCKKHFTRAMATMAYRTR